MIDLAAVDRWIRGALPAASRQEPGGGESVVDLAAAEKWWSGRVS